MPTLDGTGLTIDAQSEIETEIVSDVSAALGDEIETGPTSPLGQIVGIQANDQRLLQESLARVYAETYRATSTGVSLDRIGALTGSPRLPATSSTVAVNITFNAVTSISPGGLIISVDGSPDREFANTAQIDSAGPGTESHPFASLDTGPIEAPANTLTVIPIPNPSVDSVTNPADATLGRDIETDTAYRARQAQELARPASSTLDGIRIDVLDGVLDADGNRELEDVTVFENATDVTNGDGMPPHSIEVLVDDGVPAVDNDRIAQAVFDAKPGGILAYGSLSGTATDTRGGLRTVQFSRPSLVTLFLEFTLVKGPQWTADLIPALQKALAAYWQGVARSGTDLVRSQLYDVIWQVAEKNTQVVSISLVRAGRPALFDADVLIASRERGTLDTGDITILPV